MRRAREAWVGRPSRLMRLLLAPLPAGATDEAPLDLTTPYGAMRAAVSSLLDVNGLISDLETGAVTPEAADLLSQDLAWAAADLVQGFAPGVIVGPQQAPAVLGARILWRARWDGPPETAAFRLFQGAASEFLPAAVGVMRDRTPAAEGLAVMGRLVHRIAAVLLRIKESVLPPLPDPGAYK